jgi:glycosyltransferase involved in cell wall biosynthesis
MNDTVQTAFEGRTWPLVSILFITYKRIDLLERSMAAIRENTDYPNLQIVISDDASPPEIQAKMRALPADVHVLPTKNRGLGANINQGMAACLGKYILMVQDDWICEGPRTYLRDAVMLMEAQPGVGLVSFSLTLAIADRLEKLEGVAERAVLYPLDPAERDYPFLYSDQPHLRREAINEMMGPYLEDRDMAKCEYDYERRWDAQTQYRTAMFPVYCMKVFSNQGIEQSFRETRLRNRMDRVLMPVARRVKSYPLVFGTLKAIVRGVQFLLERLRIARV